VQRFPDQFRTLSVAHRQPRDNPTAHAHQFDTCLCSDKLRRACFGTREPVRNTREAIRRSSATGPPYDAKWIAELVERPDDIGLRQQKAAEVRVTKHAIPAWIMLPGRGKYNAIEPLRMKVAT
jgi:hypothetical protein